MFRPSYLPPPPLMPPPLAMHSAPAPDWPDGAFGFPLDGCCGMMSQPNAPSGQSKDWVKFWAQHRLGHQLNACPSCRPIQDLGEKVSRVLCRCGGRGLPLPPHPFTPSPRSCSAFPCSSLMTLKSSRLCSMAISGAGTTRCAPPPESRPFSILRVSKLGRCRDSARGMNTTWSQHPQLRA